jgi:NTP pyrophosphatase (non-canonical NTP hydrolase)
MRTDWMSPFQETIMEYIVVERQRQDHKWGGYRQLSPKDWLSILVEEIGEVAAAILNHDKHAVFEEAIQVAAVVFAWLEAEMFHDRLKMALPPLVGGGYREEGS